MRAKGLHRAVPIDHSDIIDIAFIPIEHAIADDHAILARAAVIAVDRDDALKAFGKTLRPFGIAAAVLIVGKGRLQAGYIRYIDIRYMIAYLQAVVIIA